MENYLILKDFGLKPEGGNYKKWAIAVIAVLILIFIFFEIIQKIKN